MGKYLGSLAALLGMNGGNMPQVQVVEADDDSGDDDSGEVQIVEADDSGDDDSGDDDSGDDDSGEVQIVEADDSGGIRIRRRRTRKKRKASPQLVVVNSKPKAKTMKLVLPNQRRAGDQFDKAGQRVAQQSTALSTVTPIAAFKLVGPLAAGEYERPIGCPDFFVQTSLFANAKAVSNVSSFRFTIGGMPGNGNTIDDYPEKYGANVQNRTIEMRELSPGMPLAVTFTLATALAAGESAVIILEGARGNQTALRSPAV